MFECPGQLVRATCSTSLAINTIQQGYDILDLAAYAQSGHALGVTVTAFGVLDLTDDISFGLNVYRFGANDRASLEGSLPDTAFHRIAQLGHIISDIFHLFIFFRNIRKKIAN